MSADPRRVKELFAAALDLADEPARQAFLDHECAGDAELRQRLEALLHAHDQPQPALDQPLVGVAPAEDNQTGPFRGPGAGAAEEYPGAVLGGKYKLIERIGEGGMGSVWMAQQTEPVKRMVAVKLIKGGDDSKAVLARFEAERQALALMDHPNIARVLDAGTVGDPGEPSPVRGRVRIPDNTRPLTGLGSPRPFFVMELVKGVPITKFCDARKLTPRQRLELFIPVCQAIQHAHQKGIIHRDIKPSNVLIALYDDSPVPKVIDFGVAKATGAQLTEQTLHTGFGSIVGTLEYMSPEQATLNNLDIDTRSDIYSLGVLLYELLSGSVPVRRKDLEKAGMLEMLRIIREEEPPKPSTKASTADALPSVAANRGMEPAKLTRLLRGEIDWMVMKALEKERSRRYETANGMAMDIQRYLADEPVSAGPPSAAYRLKKFVKRNKGQVVAAGLVLLALMVGVVGLSVGLWAVEREREKTQAALGRALRAEDEAEEAEAATLTDYRASTDDAIEQLIGSKSVLGPQEKTYLEKTLKRWQVFAARVGDDVRSRVIRAEGLHRVASLRLKLGQTEEAAAGFRAALAMYQKLAEQFPSDPAKRANLASTYMNLGLLLEGQNQGDAAAKQYLKGQEILQKLAEDFTAEPTFRSNLASAHINLGVLLKDQNQGDKAAEQYQKALAIRQKLVDDFPDVIEYRYYLATDQNNLGLLLAEQNQGEKALAEYRKSLDSLQKLAEKFPTVPKYRNELARTHGNLGLLLKSQNQWVKAAEQYREVLLIRQQLADDFPSMPEYRQELARNHHHLGNLLKKQNQWEKAAEQYRKALAIEQKLADDFPTIPEYRRFLAVTYDSTGFLLEEQLQWEKAAEQYRRALAIEKKLADEFPKVPEYRYDLAGTYASIARLLTSQNQGEQAVEHYEKALAIQQKLADEFPKVPEYRKDLAATFNNLGFLLRRQNQSTKAAEQFNKALTIQQKLAGDFPKVPEYRALLSATHLNLGNLLAAQNQGKKAAEQYSKALAIRQNLADEFPKVPEYRKELAATFNNLGALLKRQNQGTKAAEQYYKALAIQQKLAAEFSAMHEYRNDLAATYYNLGILLAAQNQRERAIEQYCKALDIQQKLAEQFPTVPDYGKSLAMTHTCLGIVLEHQTQGEKASEHHRKALEIVQKLADDFPSVSAYQVDLGGSCCNYGNFLRRGGKPADSLPWYDKAIQTLTKVHQQDPQVVIPRLFLRNSHSARAQANYQLEKYAEAVRDSTQAIEFSPLEEQPLYRALRASSRVRMGRVASAVAEVAELMKAGNWPAAGWYDFACIYAVASGKSTDKKREYADRAMELLHKAVKAGFKDAMLLANDKDLEVLRQSGDFKKLVADLEAAARAKKTKEP